MMEEKKMEIKIDGLGGDGDEDEGVLMMHEIGTRNKMKELNGRIKLILGIECSTRCERERGCERERERGREREREISIVTK